MPRVWDIGVQASPHAWVVPLKSLYTAQMAVCLGNIPIVEGVFGTAEGLDTSSYPLVDGNIQVPNAPSFGIEMP